MEAWIIEVSLIASNNNSNIATYDIAPAANPMIYNNNQYNKYNNNNNIDGYTYIYIKLFFYQNKNNK